MEVEIAPPSSAQMTKLHSGQPFRATIGAGLKIRVPDHVGKKLMKASMKGMGATVDSCHCMGCGMCGGNVTHTAKDSGSRLLVSGTDRAVRALEGSGKNKHYMRTAAQTALLLANPASMHARGGNVTHTAKDSGSRLLVSGTDRAVRALEGSGYGGNLKKVAKKSASRLLVSATDRAVRALEGSGSGGNVTHTAKDSGSRLLVSGTDRAVRALEGSGRTTYTSTGPGGNTQTRYVDTGKLVKTGAGEGSGDTFYRYNEATGKQEQYYPRREMEGLGLPRNGYYKYNEGTGEYEQYYPRREMKKTAMGGAVNPFAKQQKKMEKKLDKEKDDLMKQMNQQMKKQSGIMKKAKEAVKTKSASVNKDLMNKVTQQVKVSKKLMSKAADLREEAVDKLQGQMRQYTRQMPMEGGKVNRRKKFDQWFKSIGSKFKTLNHNLAPIKKAATDRAVQVIKYTKNPVAQGKALLDMGKEEFGDDDDVSVPPTATTQMINQGLSPETLSNAISSNSFSQIQAEGQPVDVNDDGETDGYFYPREMSYFGAGKRRKMRGGARSDGFPLSPAQLADPRRQPGYTGGRSVTVHQQNGGTRNVKVGLGMGEVGRPTIMPVTPIQRPVPVQRGMGAKKSSPWIEHVKDYASKHGVKYGEALKLAKSTYKKGGALYPAGYQPEYGY
jgi:ferredoxin